MEKIINTFAKFASGRISKKKLITVTFSVALIFTAFYLAVQDVKESGFDFSLPLIVPLFVFVFAHGLLKRNTIWAVTRDDCRLAHIYALDKVVLKDEKSPNLGRCLYPDYLHADIKRGWMHDPLRGIAVYVTFSASNTESWKNIGIIHLTIGTAVSRRARLRGIFRFRAYSRLKPSRRPTAGIASRWYRSRQSKNDRKNTMSDDFRNQLYNALSLKGTDELIEIWKTNDRSEWSDVAFAVIQEILRNRIGEIPAQGASLEELSDNGNIGDSTKDLANTSLILSILGFSLPCPAFFLLGGFREWDLLNTFGPLVLSSAGPIGIIVGIFALSEVNISKTSKSRADAGIALGTLSTILIFLPLLCQWLIFNMCKNGC
jgi:hypothetical protein